MQKHVVPFLLIFAFPSVILVSCSKSGTTQQTTISPGACDTVGMRYSAHIVPILQSYCYGCHGADNTGGSGGINLDGYSNLSVYAADGKLLGDLTHASGFKGMPYNLPKLDDCTINKVVDWINRGYPNN